MAIGLAVRGASMAGRAGGMGARAESSGLRDMKNMTEKIKKMADSGDFSFLKDKGLLEKLGGKNKVLERFGIDPGKIGVKEEKRFNPYKKEWGEKGKRNKKSSNTNE